MVICRLKKHRRKLLPSRLSTWTKWKKILTKCMLQRKKTLQVSKLNQERAAEKDLLYIEKSEHDSVVSKSNLKLAETSVCIKEAEKLALSERSNVRRVQFYWYSCFEELGLFQHSMQVIDYYYDLDCGLSSAFYFWWRAMIMIWAFWVADRRSTGTDHYTPEGAFQPDFRTSWESMWFTGRDLLTEGRAFKAESREGCTDGREERIGSF